MAAASSKVFLPAGPPYVGALLRLTWQAVRNRLLRAFSDAGFGDIGASHFGVIQ